MIELTTAPEQFLAISPEEIRDAAERNGVPKYLDSFVVDLAHLAAGGEIRDKDTVLAEVAQAAIDAFPTTPTAGDGEWSLPDNSTTDDRDVAMEAKVKHSQMSALATLKLIQSLNLTSVPGDTPLDVAFYVQRKLNELASQKDKDNDQDGGGPGGPPPPDLPIFGDSDPDDDESENENEDGVSGELLEVAQRTMNREELEHVREIALKLSTNRKLKQPPAPEYEADREGDESRVRTMNSFDELMRLVPTEWAKRRLSPAYFQYQMVTGELQVKERVQRKRRKQKLYFLLDRSGSMTEYYRKARGVGVLLDRLAAVDRGEAELSLRLYDMQSRDARHATNEEESKALLQYVLNDRSRGNGTDIDSALRLALADIKKAREEGEDYIDPEIMIVLDGDDSISISPHEFNDGENRVKVHVVLVGHENAPLRRLAEATGGVSFVLEDPV